MAKYFSGVPQFTRLQCPDCGAIFVYPFECATGATLAVLITHVNDIHRWTRERIADWVESLEAREESRALAAVDPHVADPGTLTTRV